MKRNHGSLELQPGDLVTIEIPVPGFGDPFFTLSIDAPTLLDAPARMQ